jgi:hypothetical protein
MKKLAILAVMMLSLAARARAISLTMGNPGFANSGDTSFGEGTLVDLNNPATATGTLTQVEIGWLTHPCAAPGKIKVFHRAGNTLTLGAEESFNIPSSAGFDFSITLSSPLPVQQGDLLGVSNTGTCNGPLVNTLPFAGFSLVTSGDASSLAFDPESSPRAGGLAISATGIVSEFRAGVIPGVGSGPGSNGSHFKTSLQMIANPIGGDVTGKLVFHTVGIGGSAADPSTPFTIPQGHALAFDDVVTAMGQTGFGTIDVVVAAGSSVPVTVARVFNQSDDGGTAGLGEELVNTSGQGASGGLAIQVIPAGFTGFMSAPPNTENTRFNVGVRTLDSGASVQYVLKDSAGNTVANAHQLLPPNYFNQVDATILFGLSGSSIGANDYVEVTVSTGSAIAYGSSTDGTTNDPSVQFVYPVFGIA